MHKTTWTRSAAVVGAAAFAMAATASPANAQAPAPDHLEGSIQMEAIETVIGDAVALSAVPWALSAYGGSIVACLFNDCAGDNNM